MKNFITGKDQRGTPPRVCPFLAILRINVGREPEMKVNGGLVSVLAGSTLAAFLTQSGYNLERIAVERNGAIVPKRDYETTRLKAEDSLEIVCFVGGG